MLVVGGVVVVGLQMEDGVFDAQEQGADGWWLEFGGGVCGVSAAFLRFGVLPVLLRRARSPAISAVHFLRTR